MHLYSTDEELGAYSTHKTQAGDWRDASMSLLLYFVWLVVWGWKPEVAHHSLQRSLQNIEVYQSTRCAVQRTGSEQANRSSGSGIKEVDTSRKCTRWRESCQGPGERPECDECSFSVRKIRTDTEELVERVLGQRASRAIHYALWVCWKESSTHLPLWCEWSGR